MEEHFNAFAGGEDGRHARAVVRDGDLSLGREARRRDQGRRLVGTVDHGGR